MRQDELESITAEMRRELARRQAVREGWPANFGEAEAEQEITEDLLTEAEDTSDSPEERARIAARLLAASARCMRLIERL